MKKTIVFPLFILLGLNPAFGNHFQTFFNTHIIQYNSVDFQQTIIADDTDCPRKLKSCKGAKSWKDGTSYEGEFKYGEAHGWGTFRWPDGAVYIGEFEAGLRHGHGQQTFANGDRYSGEWREGHMHGKGAYDWADKSKYVGVFSRGLMQGKGILTLENGESYDGEWKNGLADGQGEYVRVDGSKYIGKHKSGKRNGSGVITWRTGDVFIGKWKNGKAHKAGTFQFTNGDKYMCIWENGEMTGEATYILVNGREIKGNPRMIEKEIETDIKLFESTAPNLGITWYAIAVEYMMAEKYHLAKENFEIAQQFVPPSSSLNQLIHQQLEIIKTKEVTDGL